MMRSSPPCNRVATRVNAERGSEESHREAISSGRGGARDKNRRHLDSGERRLKKSARASRSPGPATWTGTVEPSRRVRKSESVASGEKGGAVRDGTEVFMDQVSLNALRVLSPLRASPKASLVPKSAGPSGEGIARHRVCQSQRQSLRLRHRSLAAKEMSHGNCYRARSHQALSGPDCCRPDDHPCEDHPAGYDAPRGGPPAHPR